MEQKSHWRNNSWEVLQTLMKPDQDNQNKTFHWYFPFTWLRNKVNVQCKKKLAMTELYAGSKNKYSDISIPKQHPYNNVLEYTMKEK